MNKATVKTVWFWRKSEDSPELLTAWDEYDVEQNAEGFEADWKKAYAVVEKEDAGYGVRRIDLTFDFDPVMKAFYPVEVDASADALFPVHTAQRTTEENE